ncbi:MAG: prepilin-type N-terminal cleavage/methylation domain-containing protein [Lachnospiraceae bacterium]|jgi:prepilin-type N-terminal cleavage/methylation domain-containing protein|nr:prepilin-type N-terminal cleavage/methylation domain-containing protein [Lachnospiraceae bacterium]
MSIRKDQNGFSLIELVVVIGIIAVLATFSLSMLGRLRSANAEKAVQTLSASIKKLQANSMSKAQKPYMYIYKVGNTYYVRISTNAALLGTDLTASSGTELATGIKISTKVNSADAATEVTNTNFLKIYFQKDGSLGTGVTPNYIIVEAPSSNARQIKFNRDTGKHITGYAE